MEERLTLAHVALGLREGSAESMGLMLLTHGLLEAEWENRKRQGPKYSL